jgi:hypothetical protein
VQPSQGDCQLVTSNLLTSNTKTIPISELQGAKLDKANNFDGSQNQQVVLLTKREQIPLWFVRTYKEKMTSAELNYIVTDVNKFVKDPQQLSFEFHRGEPLIGLAFMSIMGLNLFWLAFCSDVVTCDFDKTRGSVIKQRRWFGFITRNVEYPLSDIVDINIKEKWNRSGRSYRIILLLASAKNLSLTGSYNNYFRKREKAEAAVDTIEQFLNRQKIYPLG